MCENWACGRPCSIAGRRSFSRTERLPFKHRSVPTARWRGSKRIEFLEKKVQTKDEVLAELMAEHVALKKLGEL
jgi:hypothetical protein